MALDEARPKTHELTLVAATVEAIDAREVDEAESFELEDSGPALHYLLSGEDGVGPLTFLAEDDPYPVRGVAVEDVRLVADLIEGFPARVIRERLESPGLMDCPPFLGRPLEDEHKEWLLAVLHGVMVFLRRAATNGHAVLVVRLGDD
ncbi:MAG TPA: DUF1877 family protein [Myxococcota bacterium]|nr:DUF1877 family protein [Myxococcota bacterium]